MLYYQRLKNNPSRWKKEIPKRHKEGAGIEVFEILKKTVGKSEEYNFTKCFEKHYGEILKHAAYITGSLQAGEDIAQDTFAKLHKVEPDNSNVRAWLFKVSTNLSYNYIRSLNIRKAKEPAITEYEMDKVISIEEAAIKNIEVRRTKKVLSKLSPRDRLCLMLKFSGYQYTEIAEIIEVQNTSVGKIISRAQEKFKRLYEKEVKN